MSILLFLVVLSVLVLVHEAGHYLAARWSGVKAEEFGLGFPPRALGWTKAATGKWRRVPRNEQSAERTIWSLNWLPLGGFVRLKGEQGEAAGERDAFMNASLGRKFLIIAAGVLMNLLLAWAILAAGFAIGVPLPKQALPPGAVVRSSAVEVTTVVEGAPAAKAGLLPGDRLLAVEGVVAPLGQENVLEALKAASSAGKPIVFEVVRGADEQKRLVIQPAFVPELGRTAIGAGIEERVVARLPLHRAVLEGARNTAFLAGAIVKGLGSLVSELFAGRGVGEGVSGPVGIAVLTGKVADQGPWALAHFAAVLSVNLAVVNFLPIPGLDGGRALFLLVELVRRKQAQAKVEAAVHSIGFLVLLLLILLVTIQDLRRFGPAIWRGIAGWF